MRLIIYSALCILFCSQAKAISFKSLSYADAMLQAQQENKNVLVVYSAAWCLPCQIMKNSVFLDNEINQMVDADWIAVMIEYDDRSNLEWINNFDVHCLPTNLLLNAKGEVIGRNEGGLSISQFKNFLINKNVQNIGAVSIPTASPTISTSTSAQSTIVSAEGKIMVDGVLLDPFTNNGVENPTTQTIVEEMVSIDAEVNYIVQLGAFASLDKVKKHQKDLSYKQIDNTMIIVDPTNEKFPFKLVSKERYNQENATTYASNLKSKGIDCFIRIL